MKRHTTVPRAHALSASHEPHPPRQRQGTDAHDDAQRTDLNQDATHHDITPASEPAPGSPHTVLVVDDAEDSRELLRWQLGGDTHLKIVGEAGDGELAVQRAADLQPDLIILDLNMPHRDGLSVIPQLYAAAPRTRVVVLTSYNSPNALHTALDLGAVHCLLKGTPRVDLLHALHRALRLRD